MSTCQSKSKKSQLWPGGGSTPSCTILSPGSVNLVSLSFPGTLTSGPDKVYRGNIWESRTIVSRHGASLRAQVEHQVSMSDGHQTRRDKKGVYVHHIRRAVESRKKNRKNQRSLRKEEERRREKRGGIKIVSTDVDSMKIASYSRGLFL